MSRRAQAGGNWITAICALVLTVAGCGSDSTAGYGAPAASTDTRPVISGTIYAPDMNGDGIGIYASRSWWHWADQLTFVPQAYALQHIAAIASDQTVALLQLDATEAEHGSTERAKLVAQTRTMAGGHFTITDSAITPHPEEVCRLMLVVGSGSDQTRAFVLSHTTDLNAVNESVVRMVLHRLTEMPPVGLCDFQAEALQDITDAANLGAYSVSGATVAELNDKAFAAVAAYRPVQEAMAAVVAGAAGTP